MTQCGVHGSMEYVKQLEVDKRRLADTVQAQVDEMKALHDKIVKLQEVVEIAHKYRVTIMLILHNVKDVLSEKQTGYICAKDSELQKAIVGLRHKGKEE